MSKQVQDIIARGDARIVDAPDIAKVRHQIEVDRCFELPTGLYAATVACYLGFLVITGAAFMAPALAIPMAIFAFFIVAGFGVPAIWVRLKSNAIDPNTSRPLTADNFEARGIMTHTGPCTARDARVQVLILPVLIVLWGIAATTIAALV